MSVSGSASLTTYSKKQHPLKRCDKRPDSRIGIIAPSEEAPGRRGVAWGYRCNLMQRHPRLLSIGYIDFFRKDGRARIAANLNDIFAGVHFPIADGDIIV